jgi:hypothetical protein
MGAQPREEAIRIIDASHLVYVVVKPPVLVRVSKLEARSLVRGVEWSEGFHITERPDLGPRCCVISSCDDHSQCGSKEVA